MKLRQLIVLRKSLQLGNFWNSTFISSLLVLALNVASNSLLLFWGSQSHAQLLRNQTLELNCVHLFPIQMKYLEKHVNFTQVSTNMEFRTQDQLIKRLDPQKLYFMEKDVNQVHKIMSALFKKIQQKECGSIDQVEKLFEQRVKERVDYAKKYLGEKFVFNPKTKIILDPDHRKRAQSVGELNKFHESYLQYQISTYLATDMKVEEAKSQVVRNYERLIRRVHEMTKQDVWSNYLDSFARSLDPHSSYMSADALEDFEIQMRLSLEGIGATLSSQDGFTVIEQLIAGGAAYNSGKLKPKDKIVAVAQGEKGEFQNVIEMDLRDVVRLIRGTKGSKVKLKVLRKAAKETEHFEVVLVRDQIKLEDEAASVTYLDRTLDNVKKKIALIDLPSFYADNRKDGPSAARDMKKLLADINKNNADAVVLDLSTNGGGSLKDAVDIAGLFFATGNVVKQSQKSNASEQYEYEVLKDTDEQVDWTGPLVILISRVSASASEIVSGTLKDYKRAIVVGGDHTFGKGTVQSVEYLPPGLGAIKTTVGMFFVAGGNSTQHRGVNADIIWPSIYSSDEIGEKTLDYSLPPKKIKEFLSPSAYVTEGKNAWKPLQQAVIDKVNKKSLDRVSKSEDFKKVREEIAKIKKRGFDLIIGELLKDKSEKQKKDKLDGKPGTETSDPSADGAEGNLNLSREERKKKYLERADIQEALNVAHNLSEELTASSKNGHAESTVKELVKTSTVKPQGHAEKADD
ncbi:MAG: PDZ domain-containing protein [Bdellovibrionales bacterium]|nr:PDZ domain-containing protein [Bdellovibrionales bacterium]